MSVLKLSSCFSLGPALFSNEVQVLREKVLQTKLTEARTSPLGIVVVRDKSGQIITSAAVTSNGGLIREPPKCPNSAGITVVCLDELLWTLKRQIWKVTWCQTWCSWHFVYLVGEKGGGFFEHLLLLLRGFFGGMMKLGDLSDGFQKSCL